MTLLLLVIAVFFLAYSNGANDNFKGVATLYGSSTTSFRGALRLATVTTFGGSLASLLLASSLARTFSGNDLVPPELAGTSSLLITAGAAAAATILLATFIGMPTSTTHALTGALTGIACVSGGWETPFPRLWAGFLLPLLVAPWLAIAGTCVGYPMFRWGRRMLGVQRDTCICVGPKPDAALAGVALAVEPAHPLRSGALPINIAATDECVRLYHGRLVGIDAQSAVNWMHYGSAATVCFARAVNDTPKIAALLLAGGLAGGAGWKLALVAVAMGLGGLLSSRRVAETMSRRVTDINPGQGLTGNLVTAALVLGASHLGFPVSTTHVSCGSLFGIGVVTGAGRWKTVGQILATWVTTLPCGAALGGGLFWLLTRLGG